MVGHDWYPLLLFAHLGATFYMVGVIWFVQLVHYPLFAEVPDDRFGDYQEKNVRRTTFVVFPGMFVEIVCALLLALDPATEQHFGLNLIAFGLLLGIWASTALLQVPAHTVLGSGFDPEAHTRLVRTNWIRTVLWSIRGILAIAMFRI